MVKNAHMRQIEQMESEELMTQKKLRTEVIQLEDMLAQVRKEYEMLRIEFEQNLAVNEQTGQQAEFEDLINAELTKSEELQNKLDDLGYELTKSRTHKGKLENGLVDTQVNTL